MQYGLRFLFVLTTIVAIFVAVQLMRRRHEAALARHHQEFDIISNHVSQLPPSIAPLLAGVPEVMERLEEANALAPLNAINGGHSGTTSGGLVGNPLFLSYRFKYHWPDKGGVSTPATEVNVTVSSTSDWKDLTGHVIHITYDDTPLNRLVADHVEKTLKQIENARIEHQRKPAPIVSPESLALKEARAAEARKAWLDSQAALQKAALEDQDSQNGASTTAHPRDEAPKRSAPPPRPEASPTQSKVLGGIK